jgi:hypothetical protein
MPAIPPDPTQPGSFAPQPDTPSQRQMQRQRLADLLGRLLAHHWLRTQHNRQSSLPTASSQEPRSKQLPENPGHGYTAGGGPTKNWRL